MISHHTKKTTFLKFKIKKIFKRLFLPQHGNASLQWAQEYRNWAHLDRNLDSVLFKWVTIWSTVIIGGFAQLNFTGDVFPVMFWGGVMFGRRTPLILIEWSSCAMGRKHLAGRKYQKNNPSSTLVRNEFHWKCMG